MTPLVAETRCGGHQRVVPRVYTTAVVAGATHAGISLAVGTNFALLASGVLDGSGRVIVNVVPAFLLTTLDRYSIQGATSTTPDFSTMQVTQGRVLRNGDLVGSLPGTIGAPGPPDPEGRLMRRDGTLRDEGRKQGSPHRRSPLAIHPWQSARPVDESDRRVSINPGTVSALASSSRSCHVRGGRPFEVGARPLLLSITPVLSPRVARLRAPLLFPTIAFWPNRCRAERTRSVCDPAHTSLVVRVSIRNIIGPCGDGPSLSPSC